MVFVPFETFDLAFQSVQFWHPLTPFVLCELQLLLSIPIYRNSMCERGGGAGAGVVWALSGQSGVEPQIITGKALTIQCHSSQRVWSQVIIEQHSWVCVKHYK